MLDTTSSSDLSATPSANNELPRVVIDTTGCDTTKGCWRSDAHCTQTTCQYLVTYTLDASGQYVLFEMSGMPSASSNAYFAMALSTSGGMGDFYSVACYNSNGQWQVGNGHIYMRGFMFDENNLINTSVSYSGGIVSCKFARSREASGYSDDLSQDNSSFYLIASTGSLTPGSPPSLQYHTNRWSSAGSNGQFNLAQYQIGSASSSEQATTAGLMATTMGLPTTMPDANTTSSSDSLANSTLPSANNEQTQVVIDTTGCDTTKGCWRSDAHCTQTTCQYLVTYTLDASGQYMLFEMSGMPSASSNTYFAMALSTSGGMGDFYSVACYNNNGSWHVANGHIYMRGFTFDDYNLINSSVSFSDGIVSCAFARSRQATGFSDDLSKANSSFYLIASTGPLTPGPTPTFEYHTNRWSSSGSNAQFNLAQYRVASEEEEVPQTTASSPATATTAGEPATTASEQQPTIPNPTPASAPKNTAPPVGAFHANANNGRRVYHCRSL